MEENQTVKLINIYELMKELRITRPTIDRWRKAGMPCHTAVPEGKLFFDLAEVQAWIKRDKSNEVKDRD